MTDYIDIDESEAKQRLNDMTWMGGGKKPLYSQIMTGYMLSKAVWFFAFFLDKAISCIDQSVIDMNADSTPTDALEVAEHKALLLELKAMVIRKEKVVHLMLSDGLEDKGYGKIASSIFFIIGAGVIRK